MALVALFQPDPISHARITSALGELHELVPCPDWGDFHEALQRLPLDACVLDIYHPSQPVALAEVKRLRKRHTSVAIVVHASFCGREADLFALGRLRIDGVMLSDWPDGAARIRDTFAEALARSVASRVVVALRPHLSPMALECLRWAIENAHRRPGVADLARPFSRPPRSLTRMLRRDGAPAPGRLLIWGRLFRAAHMLQDRTATVERVAYVLGYSSGAALGRAFRRDTGHPPGEVLRRGGIGCVLDGFVHKESRPVPPRAPTRWRSGVRSPFLRLR